MDLKHLEIFNRQILFMNCLNNDLANLFKQEYNILNELSLIRNFLDDYYYLAKSRIINYIVSFYEPHKNRGKKQLSIEYFVIDASPGLKQQFEELRTDIRYKKIKDFRNKLYGHLDFHVLLNEKKYIEETELYNVEIYTFVKDTVKFALQLNRYFGEIHEDFEVMNPSSEDLISLAEDYNLLDKIDLSCLRQMKRNDINLFNKIKLEISDIIKRKGY